jgi:hypothetical protein
MTTRTWVELTAGAVLLTAAAFLGCWAILIALGLLPFLALGALQLRARKDFLETVRRDALAHWPGEYWMPRELARQARRDREAMGRLRRELVATPYPKPEPPREMPIMEPYVECPGCEYPGPHMAELICSGSKWRYTCFECGYLWPLL